MNILRSLAALSFVAGAALLVLGFAASRGGGSTPAVPTPFDIVATATPTDVVPTATDAPGPTATPTPLPFDGKVARLEIPRFKVNSAVEQIGLLANNQMDTPHDPHNTGWYGNWDKPGWVGNAVFSGHVDYFPDILGPFYNLKNVDLGDQIVIAMQDGPQYVYRVIRKTRYDAATWPGGDIVWPKDRPEGKEWITLITCGGRFQQTQPDGAGDYLDRDVVVAERVQ
jgi:sortase (surface protein transpeptidase)